MARIGVFVCHCGVNIAKTVDCPKVAEAAREMPGVVYAADYRYMCSDPGQNMIKDMVREMRLDKVVVASCSPTLHEETFETCIADVGLNKKFFEMANIREHCSWVHSDKAEATAKAIDLVAMAVAKANRALPLVGKRIPVEKKALVIGGGISGIQAAIDIGLAGHKVVLVERSPSIGGRMAQFDKTFPTLDCAACILTPKMVEAARNPNVTIYTYSEVEEVSGFVGNFEVKIRKKARSVDIDACNGCGLCYQKCPVKVLSEFDEQLGMRRAIYVPFPQAVPNIPVIDRKHCIWFEKRKCGVCKKLCPRDAVDFDQEDEIIDEKFGAVVVATGFQLFDHTTYGEYGYGKIKDIITSLQFERMLSPSGPSEGHVYRPSDGKPPKKVVFLSCIGSRDPAKGMEYCSRLCCMYIAKQALLLREHHPDAEAYVFYIDIRAAGKNYEEFVRRVQVDYQVKYIRGRVSAMSESDGKVMVRGMDTLTTKQFEIDADLVVLGAGLVAQPDAVRIAHMLNIPYDKNKFFTEAHPKLRPVEVVSSGVFLTGACQAPKDIPDSVATASAASAKVCGLFANDYLVSNPMVATIDTDRCTGCFSCVSVCPYKAISKSEILIAKPDVKKPVAEVNEVLCQGCGTCAAICKNAAVDLRGFADEQLHDQIESFSFSEVNE